MTTPSPSPQGRLVFGVQPVRELLKRHGDAVSEVVLAEGDSPRLGALERFAHAQGVPTRRLSRGQLDSMTKGAMHQGALAWGPELTLTAVEELLVRPALVAVALDGVVDPQNFGAVVRSAVGICEAPIIWPQSGAAPLTPTTFRASAGAIEHATLCRVRSLHGTLSQAVSAGVTVVGLAPEAGERLDELDLAGPTIVVIGSEEKGMSRAVRRSCTSLVRLASSSRIQSLNASVAAAVSLYQVMVSRLKTIT
jgi:23S rRNA (guanosine2251-2'-O)-methyltransferase